MKELENKTFEIRDPKDGKLYPGLVMCSTISIIDTNWFLIVLQCSSSSVQWTWQVLHLY